MSSSNNSSPKSNKTKHISRHRRDSEVRKAAQSIDRQVQNVKKLKRQSIGSIDLLVDPDLELTRYSSNTSYSSASSSLYRDSDSEYYEDASDLDSLYDNNSLRLSRYYTPQPYPYPPEAITLSSPNRVELSHNNNNPELLHSSPDASIDSVKSCNTSSDNSPSTSVIITKLTPSPSPIKKRVGVSPNRRQLTGVNVLKRDGSPENIQSFDQSIAQRLFVNSNEKNNDTTNKNSGLANNLLWVPANQHPTVRPDNYVELISDTINSINDDKTQKPPSPPKERPLKYQHKTEHTNDITNNHTASISQTASHQNIESKNVRYRKSSVRRPSSLRKSYTDLDFNLQEYEETMNAINNKVDTHEQQREEEISFANVSQNSITLKDITEELNKLSTHAGLTSSDAITLAKTLSLSDTLSALTNDNTNDLQEQFTNSNQSTINNIPQTTTKNEEDEYASDIIAQNNSIVPQRSTLRRSKFTTYRKKSGSIDSNCEPKDSDEEVDNVHVNNNSIPSIVIADTNNDVEEVFTDHNKDASQKQQNFLNIEGSADRRSVLSTSPSDIYEHYRQNSNDWTEEFTRNKEELEKSKQEVEKKKNKSSLSESSLLKNDSDIPAFQDESDISIDYSLDSIPPNIDCPKLGLHENIPLNDVPKHENIGQQPSEKVLNVEYQNIPENKISESKKSHKTSRHKKVIKDKEDTLDNVGKYISSESSKGTTNDFQLDITKTRINNNGSQPLPRNEKSDFSSTRIPSKASLSEQEDSNSSITSKSYSTNSSTGKVKKQELYKGVQESRHSSSKRVEKSNLKSVSNGSTNLSNDQLRRVSKASANTTPKITDDVIQNAIPIVQSVKIPPRPPGKSHKIKDVSETDQEPKPRSSLENFVKKLSTTSSNQNIKSKNNTKLSNSIIPKEKTSINIASKKNSSSKLNSKSASSSRMSSNTSTGKVTSKSNGSHSTPASRSASNSKPKSRIQSKSSSKSNSQGQSKSNSKDSSRLSSQSQSKPSFGDKISNLFRKRSSSVSLSSKKNNSVVKNKNNNGQEGSRLNFSPSNSKPESLQKKRSSASITDLFSLSKTNSNGPPRSSASTSRRGSFEQLRKTFSNKRESSNLSDNVVVLNEPERDFVRIVPNVINSENKNIIKNDVNIKKSINKKEKENNEDKNSNKSIVEDGKSVLTLPISIKTVQDNIVDDEEEEEEDIVMLDNNNENNKQEKIKSIAGAGINRVISEDKIPSSSIFNLNSEGEDMIDEDMVEDEFDSNEFFDLQTVQITNLKDNHDEVKLIKETDEILHKNDIFEDIEMEFEINKSINNNNNNTNNERKNNDIDILNEDLIPLRKISSGRLQPAVKVTRSDDTSNNNNNKDIIVDSDTSSIKENSFQDAYDTVLMQDRSIDTSTDVSTDTIRHNVEYNTIDTVMNGGTHKIDGVKDEIIDNIMEFDDEDTSIHTVIGESNNNIYDKEEEEEEEEMNKKEVEKYNVDMSDDNTSGYSSKQEEDDDDETDIEIPKKLTFEDVIRPEHANSGMIFTESAFGFPLPPLTVSTVIMIDHRLPVNVERAIYRLSHLKLGDPKRALREQVLLSNFMYSYLHLVNHTLYLEQANQSDEEEEEEDEDNNNIFDEMIEDISDIVENEEEEEEEERVDLEERIKIKNGEVRLVNFDTDDKRKEIEWEDLGNSDDDELADITQEEDSIDMQASTIIDMKIDNNGAERIKDTEVLDSNNNNNERKISNTANDSIFIPEIST